MHPTLFPFVVSELSYPFFEWAENLPAIFDFSLERGRIRVGLPGTAPFRIEARTGQGRIHHGFAFAPATDAGPGQVLEAATAPAPLVSLGLRIGNGNISLEPVR
ncbi:MAG: hypothetical protein ABIR29_04615 [Chthoniobacterales bacterium]